MKTYIVCGLMIIVGLVMIGYSAHNMVQIKQRQDDEIVRRISEACKRD